MRVKLLRVKTPYFLVKQQTELTNVLINFPTKISKSHKLKMAILYNKYIHKLIDTNI